MATRILEFFRGLYAQQQTSSERNKSVYVLALSLLFLVVFSVLFMLAQFCSKCRRNNKYFASALYSSTNCTEISVKSIRYNFLKAKMLRFRDPQQLLASKVVEDQPKLWTQKDFVLFLVPWFKPSGLAINQDVYQNECLKKILIPFLQKHHADGQYVFWPDKASSHYAKKTQSFLNTHSIPFVPKNHNPTNLPQCRPIEDFFGVLSSLVYKNNWRATNCKQLIGRIKRCIRKVDMKAVQRSCSDIKRKLRRTSDYGPFSNVH